MNAQENEQTRALLACVKGYQPWKPDVYKPQGSIFCSARSFILRQECTAIQSWWTFKLKYLKKKKQQKKNKTQTYEVGDETSIELTVSNKHSDSLFSSYLKKKSDKHLGPVSRKPR